MMFFVLIIVESLLVFYKRDRFLSRLSKKIVIHRLNYKKSLNNYLLLS